jgi:hypothetical protein
MCCSLHSERNALTAEGFAGIIADLQATGIVSLRGIAVAVNERHVTTRRGDGRWQVVTKTTSCRS